MSENNKGGGAAGKALRYLRKRGVGEFAAHAVEKIRDKRFDYDRWIRSQEISSARAGYQRSIDLKRMPAVFVMPIREGQGIDPETEKSISAQTWRSVALTDTLTTMIPDDAFLLCMRSGDLMPRNAVYELVLALQGGADCVYADEDQYTGGGTEKRYHTPLFKPDYNPDLLRSSNYRGPCLFQLVRAIYQYFWQKSPLGSF